MSTLPGLPRSRSLDAESLRLTASRLRNPLLRRSIACVPRYVVERSFAQITDEDFLAAAVRSDEEIGERFHTITWEHSHVCIDESGGVTTFCVYDAPDEETVREHAEAFGSHTVARILELVDDVTPLDVRRRASAVDR